MKNSTMKKGVWATAWMIFSTIVFLAFFSAWFAWFSNLISSVPASASLIDAISKTGLGILALMLGTSFVSRALIALEYVGSAAMAKGKA